MAFTIRKGAFASGTTTATIPVPTAGNAPVAGDVMVIVLESSDSSTLAGTPVCGWGTSAIFEQTAGAGVTGVTTLSIFAKIAGASEADVSISSVGDHCAGSMFVISGSGVTATNQIVVGTANATTSGVVATPSITVTAGSLVVNCSASSRDANATNTTFGTSNGWTATDPATLTELEDRTVVTAAGGGVGYAWGVCTGTTTGQGDADISVATYHVDVFLGFAPVSAILGEASLAGTAELAAAGLRLRYQVQGLTVDAVSTTQVDLSWTAMDVPGVENEVYDIERDGTVIVFDHDTNSYTDTGPFSPGQTPSYRVRAVTHPGGFPGYADSY
jgi:hypothetical protein